MRHLFSSIAVVAAAMALAVRDASAAGELEQGALEQLEESTENLGGTDQEGGTAKDLAGIVKGGRAAADGSAPDPMAVRVAELQGMPDSDLKFELRTLYSQARSPQQKQLLPPGSLEAVQEVVNMLTPVDEDARDVQQFLNRYTYLVAKVTNKYHDFYQVKVALSEPDLDSGEYKKLAAKLPKAASSWTAENDFLVAYLTLAATDLKDKWEQRATTERRLRDALLFFERLVDVYEAQQRTFRTAYGLAKLRYLEHPGHQADLSLLMSDPRQKAAQAEFEEALENFKEKTHLARKGAASSVADGIVPEQYLSVLPFPRDRQREADDLPEDEL